MGPHRGIERSRVVIAPLRSLIGPADIANELRMERQVRTLTYLIVEGSTDWRLLSKFVDPQTSAVRSAFTKDNVISVLEILRGTSFSRLLAIVDLDYEGLLGQKTTRQDVFYTPDHDLEILLLRSPALTDVLREFGSQSKIDTASKVGIHPLQLSLEATKPLGCLRLASIRNGWALKFDQMKFDFVDTQTLSPDTTRLVEHICGRNPFATCTRSDALKQIQIEQSHGHDIWQLVVGHDVSTILAISLRKLFGTYNNGEITDELFESALRLAYTLDEFRKTPLYVDVAQWCQSNNVPPVFQ